MAGMPRWATVCRAGRTENKTARSRIFRVGRRFESRVKNCFFFGSMVWTSVPDMTYLVCGVVRRLLLLPQALRIMMVEQEKLKDLLVSKPRISALDVRLRRIPDQNALQDAAPHGLHAIGQTPPLLPSPRKADALVLRAFTAVNAVIGSYCGQCVAGINCFFNPSGLAQLSEYAPAAQGLRANTQRIETAQVRLRLHQGPGRRTIRQWARRLRQWARRLHLRRLRQVRPGGWFDARREAAAPPRGWDRWSPLQPPLEAFSCASREAFLCLKRSFFLVS